MTLYQIDSEFRALENIAYEEYGNDENYELIKKMFDELQAEKKKKVNNIIKFIKNQECLLDGVEKELDKFKSRKKQIEKSIEWLKNYVGTSIGINEKYEDEQFRVSWRKSESVEIFGEDEILEKYRDYKTTWTPIKTLIKDDIKKGLEVPGCKIVEKANIQIK